MAVVDLGDPWSEYLYVKDINKAPADAGALTCVVTFPDLTTTTNATITHPATGTYLASVADTVITQVGRYSWYGKATGANACAMSGAFEVRPATSTAILSLDDARGALSWLDADTTQDEAIRDKVDVVTAMVERIIGPVLPRAVTEDIDLCDEGFFTRKPPVISITSLTPVITSSTSYTAADFHVLSTGKVVRKDGAWLNGLTYTVIYQAGCMGAVDPDTLEAARLLLQHLWQSKRGDFGAPSMGDDDTIYVAPYAYPRRVLELLQFKRHIGIA